MRTDRRRVRRWPDRLSTVGLVLLAALTTLLVVIAVEHSTAPPPSERGVGTRPVSDAPGPGGTTASGTTGTSATGGGPAGAGDPAGAGNPAGGGATAAQAPILLALAPDGTLVTADPGSCGGPPARVRFSTDGGATFHRVRTPVPVTSVLAVSAASAGDLGFVGTDAACTAHVFSGSTQTSRWQPDPGGDTAWHLGGGKHAVHTPDGRARTGCTPVSLSSAGSVRLLCDDGQVLGTDDNGASWVVLGRAPGARLIAFAGPGVGYAVADRDGCRQALLRTGDGGATWEQRHCFDTGAVRGLATGGGSVVAAVGSQILSSDDGGKTWRSAS